MNVEALVLMLEEHLSDIKQRLIEPAWRGVVTLLDESSKRLEPSKLQLEEWADRVSSALSEYDYTRGLLQGLLFSAGLRMRGVPVNLVGLSGSGPVTAVTSERMRDKDLVDRIKGIARKARDLG